MLMKSFFLFCVICCVSATYFPFKDNTVITGPEQFGGAFPDVLVDCKNAIAEGKKLAKGFLNPAPKKFNSMQEFQDYVRKHVIMPVAKIFQTGETEIMMDAKDVVAIRKKSGSSCAKPDAVALSAFVKARIGDCRAHAMLKGCAMLQVKAAKSVNFVYANILGGKIGKNNWNGEHAFLCVSYGKQTISMDAYDRPLKKGKTGYVKNLTECKLDKKNAHVLRRTDNKPMKFAMSQFPSTRAPNSKEKSCANGGGGGGSKKTTKKTSKKTATAKTKKAVQKNSNAKQKKRKRF